MTESIVKPTLSLTWHNFVSTLQYSVLDHY